MRVFRGFWPLPTAWRGAVAAIGNFDGVHQGHLHLLRQTKEFAANLGGDRKLAVITFEPHPRDVIRNDHVTARLSPFRRKLEMFQALGVDQVMVLPFAARLMNMSAQAFVDDVLGAQFGLCGILSGEGFRFGHKRLGDCTFLARHGEAIGIQARAIKPLMIEGAPCSSSRVREALKDGEVVKANALLGQPHQILGIVRPGDRRGRELGFPTANTHPLPAATAMPAIGIYVVSAQLVGEPRPAWLPAVASLGRNPTFEGREVRLEVHILDSPPIDIYGRRLRVMFHERLRGEERYDGIEALVAQIAKDCDQARRIHQTLQFCSDPTSLMR